MGRVSRLFDRMPEQRLRMASLGITCTSLALVVVTVYLGERAEHAGFLPFSFYLANAQRPILLAMMAIYALLGGVLTWRLPRHPYGWLWLWLSFTLIYMEFGRWYTAYNLFVAERSLPLMEPIAWLTISAYSSSLAILCFVLLLFPAGRLPSRRWRPFAVTIAVLVAVAFLCEAFLPGLMLIIPYSNPYAWMPQGWVEEARQVGALASNALLLCVLISGASVPLRLRRARGIERQQVKWFAFAAVGVGVVFGMSLLNERWFTISQYWNDVLSAVAFLFLALAMVIALLRYRLYDIDLIIRRTLAWAVITALLAVIYLGVVIVAQGAFVQLTGQRSQGALVVSTLAIAALFNPLRLRVQGGIDRRFFRSKYDSERVLQDFASIARDETDIEELRRELTTVVRETMQPTNVHVWLRSSAPTEPRA